MRARCEPSLRALTSARSEAFVCDGGSPKTLTIFWATPKRLSFWLCPQTPGIQIDSGSEVLDGITPKPQNEPVRDVHVSRPPQRCVKINTLSVEKVLISLATHSPPRPRTFPHCGMGPLSQGETFPHRRNAHPSTHTRIPSSCNAQSLRPRAHSTAVQCAQFRAHTRSHLAQYPPPCMNAHCTNVQFVIPASGEPLQKRGTTKNATNTRSDISSADFTGRDSFFFRQLIHRRKAGERNDEQRRDCQNDRSRNNANLRRLDHPHVSHR